MEPTSPDYPVSEFERGLAYGEMKSAIESLRARISRLEYEREHAQETADAAKDIATDALREAVDAHDEVAEVAAEIEQTTDVLETVAIADAVADAVVAEAVEDLADTIETESDTDTEPTDVTLVDDGGTETETPRQEPEVEHDKPVKHHRRGGVYGRRR